METKLTTPRSTDTTLLGAVSHRFSCQSAAYRGRISKTWDDPEVKLGTTAAGSPQLLSGSCRTRAIHPHSFQESLGQSTSAGSKSVPNDPVNAQELLETEPRSFMCKGRTFQNFRDLECGSKMKTQEPTCPVWMGLYS